MKKFGSTSKLQLLAAAMCVLLACCSGDENVEIVTSKAERDLLGKWSTSVVSIYFMNFNGEMEFKDVLVGWSGWPEQEADAKLDSMESELRPVFNGEIIFNPDHTYNSNLGILPSFGNWKFNYKTLTLDAGPGKTVLTVKLISGSTLEVYHLHNIWVHFDALADPPEDVSVMVGTTIKLTK